MRDKILVTRSSLPPLEEYMQEISDLWESHWLTNMGCKHKELQKELIKYLQVENIDLFTNGHMALELALQAFDLKGEVITTPFTFASTTHAIVRNGLTPVFCDINPIDYCIDVDKIETLITENTCAIVPVHVYGNVCDVERIQAIADKYELKVIYDAAHAFGVSKNGVGIGNFGDASVFSFHATKVFNTIEGGAVAFNSDEYGRILYGLKNFGIRSTEIVDSIGANAKMNEFCAAMGLCNLRHINEEIEKRKIIFEYYFEILSDIPGLILPSKQDGVELNYSYFPIVIDESKCHTNRDEVVNALLKNGVVARKYFYPLTCDFECYKELYADVEVPIAKITSQRIITLPLYAELPIRIVQLICEIIIEQIVG